MPKKRGWKKEKHKIRKFFKKIDDPLKTPDFRYMLQDRYYQTYKAFQLLSGRLIEELLDLGCGWGAIPFYLMEKGIVKRMTGIDINPEHKEKFYSNARKLGLENRVEYVIHDLNQGLPDLPSTYDTITAFDTLFVKTRSDYRHGAKTGLLEHDVIVLTLKKVAKKGASLLIVNLVDEKDMDLLTTYAKIFEGYQIFPSEFGHERNLDYILASIY